MLSVLTRKIIMIISKDDGRKLLEVMDMFIS